MTHTALATKQNSIYLWYCGTVSLKQWEFGDQPHSGAKQNVILKVMDLRRAPLSFPKKRKEMIQFTVRAIVRHAWCMRGHWRKDWHHTSPSELWAEWAVNSRREVVRMSNPTFVSDTLGAAASDHSMQKQTRTHPVTSKAQGPHVLGAAVKHTGWRNRVPRTLSFPRTGWGTSSVPPPRLLRLGQGECSQECCINRVPAT